MGAAGWESLEKRERGTRVFALEVVKMLVSLGFNESHERVYEDAPVVCQLEWMQAHYDFISRQ